MPFGEQIIRLKGFAIRHRVKIQDLVLVGIALLITVYFLLEVDLFVTEGARPTAHTIEADEMPVMGAVLLVGMLVFAWRRSQEQKRENRRRLLAEQQVRELALQDPLTALPNRRRFGEALAMAAASPPSAERVHAVMMLDLNGFKQINDVHGHGVGDETLVEVGQRLQSSVRDGDLLARLGGDEFAILALHLPGAEAATSLALRVIQALEAPVVTVRAEVQVGCGIGICLFPFEGSQPDEIMRHADIALYRAKAEPQSALRFFNQEMDQQVRQRELMDRKLREAVKAQRIRPFFQPLVTLATRRVVGFEILARWHDDELGDIPPDRFIPAAEESGLIHQLTDQLLREACEEARSWPRDITLALNVSAVQLKDRTLGLRILKILGQTGFLPQRLEIEITESALVRDLEAAREVLGGLRECGVRIALDDFGTGYSSLYHLRNFRVDKIKIDRSFVESMCTQRESAEIVSALVGLARGLGLAVTAEGIEGGEQQTELIASGCEEGQGFLFGMAVPAEAARELFVMCKPAATLFRD